MLWGFPAWSADSNPLLPDWHKLLASPFPRDKLWLSLLTAVTSHVPNRCASFPKTASWTPKQSIFGSYNPLIPEVRLLKMSGKISSASPDMQKPFQNVHWRKKGKTKIKMELQSTRRNYFLAIFKYFYFYVQLVLSCSLGLPLLTLRSNWIFSASNSFRACSMPPLSLPTCRQAGIWASQDNCGVGVIGCLLWQPPILSSSSVLKHNLNLKKKK